MRTIARRGRGVALLIGGALIDLCAVVNVPGAADYSVVAGEPTVSISAFGTALVLFAGVLWVSVLWRNRWPFLALIAGGVLALIGVSYLLLLVGSVYCARKYPARIVQLSAITVATVVLFVIREALTTWGGALSWFFATRVDAGESAWVVASIVVALISLIVVAAIVLASRARSRAVENETRADYEQSRADSLTEETIRQAERERIARDMHDALAHRLSVVSLHAGALEGASGDSTQHIARTVREQTHAALQDMRGLIGELRSGPVPSTPSSMRALGAMVSELRNSGIAIHAYVVIEGAERASAQLDSAVYRIGQEALTNAMKHAASEPIDLFVHASPQDGVRIRVVNPVLAAGGVTVPGGQHGLVGIRERAAALGGKAWIGAHEASFIVDVTLPWQDREQSSLSSNGAHQ